MPIPLGPYIILTVVVFVALVIASVGMSQSNDAEDRDVAKWAARGAFLAPLWPLAFVGALVFAAGALLVFAYRALRLAVGR